MIVLSVLSATARKCARSPSWVQEWGDQWERDTVHLAICPSVDGEGGRNQDVPGHPLLGRSPRAHHARRRGRRPADRRGLGSHGGGPRRSRVGVSPLIPAVTRGRICTPFDPMNRGLRHGSLSSHWTDEKIQYGRTSRGQ